MQGDFHLNVLSKNEEPKIINSFNHSISMFFEQNVFYFSIGKRIVETTSSVAFLWMMKTLVKSSFAKNVHIRWCF